MIIVALPYNWYIWYYKHLYCTNIHLSVVISLYCTIYCTPVCTGIDQANERGELLHMHNRGELGPCRISFGDDKTKDYHK